MFRDIYKIHKIGHYCVKRNIPVIPKVLSIFKKLLFPACDIPFSTEIGEGAKFTHRGIGTVINEKAKIGTNVKIHTKVTIGLDKKGVPVIGNNCLICTGATIVGNIKIGNDCIIGAGAVVVDDIPNGSIVVGVPGRVIKSVSTELIGKPKEE